MKSTIREILGTIALALFIFLALRFVVQNYQVGGSSMEPSLHDGQFLLINKVVYLLHCFILTFSQSLCSFAGCYFEFRKIKTTQY